MSDSADKSFLGTGWSFPPTFVKATRAVEMTSENENIKQCLDNLLSTNLGERLHLPDYGSQLKRLIFQKLDGNLLNQIRSTISRAIVHYEPRIILEEIEIDDSQGTEGLVNVTIHYIIRDTNTRNNMIYPFYLKEGTNVRRR